MLEEFRAGSAFVGATRLSQEIATSNWHAPGFASFFSLPWRRSSRRARCERRSIGDDGCLVVRVQTLPAPRAFMSLPWAKRPLR